MTDVRIAEIARRQFNRFSLAQAIEAGMSEGAVAHRLARGRWVRVHQAVFAISPILPGPWGIWMAATLTEPHTSLNDLGAAAAWGMARVPHGPVTVLRPGTKGPQRGDGLIVRRSICPAGDLTVHRDIPITSPERTLIDISARASDAALARAVREGVRLERTTLVAIGQALERHSGRRGITKLRRALTRYSGLPLERARSGAEIRAMELIRDAGRPLPRLNQVIAGEEADLSWSQFKLIVEIDGGPFHLDRGEEARKESVWRRAGFEVLRIPADVVYSEPRALLQLVP